MLDIELLKLSSAIVDCPVKKLVLGCLAFLCRQDIQLLLALSSPSNTFCKLCLLWIVNQISKSAVYDQDQMKWYEIMQCSQYMHTRISQVLQCLILRSRLLQLLFLTTHTLAANTGKNAQWTCNACERMDWILTPLANHWSKFFPMHFGPSILETWHHSDVKQQQIQQIRTAWSLKGLKHPARNIDYVRKRLC